MEIMLLEDLYCIDDLYYVGDIADVDGSPWVDQATAELILLEFNAMFESAQAILRI